MAKEKQTNITLSMLELEALYTVLGHYQITHEADLKSVSYCEGLRHKVFKAINSLRGIK